MSDWRETEETRERDAPTEAINQKLSPAGIRSIKGTTDAQDAARESFADQSFRDAQGRDMTIRTYSSGDSYYVRTFDDQRTPEPPDRPSYGDAGRANLHMERDAKGDVERARLQDIEVPESYQEAGIGGRMLNQCESVSREQNAGEVYGSAPEEESTREWYAKRGYDFREEGQEVYKEL
jgi:GNAT superfamily N-acetyltransferase